MKRQVLAAALTLAGMAAHADESVTFEHAWTRADVAGELAFQVVNAADLSQTLYIAKHPGKFMEVDSAFVIGPHPSQADVFVYLGAEAVVHAVITNILVQTNSPVWMRNTWQAVTVGAKGFAVANNYHVGIRFDY